MDKLFQIPFLLIAKGSAFKSGRVRELAYQKGLAIYSDSFEESMEARFGELFTSGVDVSNFMPYELSWSPPKDGINGLWAFWSRQNNELRNLLGPLYSSVDTSSFENRTITDKIKSSLLRRTLFLTGSCLIQFWAPVRTGDRIYLTVADQPFGLNKLHKGLCSYRRLCLSKMLIPVHVNEPGDDEEHNLGPLARVFRRGQPEHCHDMSCYFSEEYPLRDYVVQLGVKSHWILPLIETVRDECIGILEILSASSNCGAAGPAAHLYVKLKEMGLKFILPSSHFRSNDVNMLIPIDRLGQSYAQKQMEDICQSHQIPFAQMWVAGSSTRKITRISSSRMNWDTHFMPFDVALRETLIREGEGVVGKAFSLRSACFCNNLSKLRISMDPSALIAREYRLAGCFAICLQSTRGGIFYILEFFLAPSGVDYGDPRNFVNKLVTPLKRNIESSIAAPLQNVGEKLFVEVLKISSDDELDSFEICTTARTGSAPCVFKHPEGREMMQHDYQQVDATNNMSAKQNHAINRNVGDSLFPAPLSASENTCSNASYQGGINIVPTHGNETTQDDGRTEPNVSSRSPRRIESSQIGRAMQPDSMRVPNHINGENLVSIYQDASAGARKQGQENVNTEQNIGAVSLPTTVSSRIRVAQPHSFSQESVAVEDINKENIIRIQQDDAKGSRKHGKVRTLAAEYEISREVLEQYSGKKLEDVARILEISRSTLKRTCRELGIQRWPPCKAKRFRPTFNPQESIHATKRLIEEQSLGNQPLPDLPRQNYSVSKPHNMSDAIEEQENSSIMVKATYRDDIIKFRLSLSSGKLDLEEEVAMRLNLSARSFKIKYFDKDEDPILVGCDADLRTCTSTLKSLGETAKNYSSCVSNVQTKESGILNSIEFGSPSFPSCGFGAPTGYKKKHY